jgi:hypothetical protein
VRSAEHWLYARNRQPFEGSQPTALNKLGFRFGQANGCQGG